MQRLESNRSVFISLILMVCVGCSPLHVEAQAAFEREEHFAQTESLLISELKAGEAAHGEDHPDVARLLNDLANFYRKQGQFAKALPHFERALKIWEATHGEYHPEIATLLGNFARLRLSQQNLSEAVSLLERAFLVSEQHLRHSLFDLSETRLASVLSQLRGEEELLYALAQAHPDNPRVRELALSAALLRKGRSVEELAGISRAIYSLGPDEHDLLEKLRKLCTQLTTLSFAGRGALSPEDYQKAVDQLTQEGEALEADLASRSTALRSLSALPAPAEIVKRVSQRLSPDSVLVELVAYHDHSLVFEPGSVPSQNRGGAHYLALLLFSNGDTRAVDLGPAAPIDCATQQLLNALEVHGQPYMRAAQTLYQLTFQPLRPLLGDKPHLLISTDGQLDLIPFDALHDGSGFLVDTFDIIYLTSGKDLLPRPGGITTSHSIVVVAAPDFDSPLATPPPIQDMILARHTAAPKRGVVSFGRAPYWDPIPGTRQEANAIQDLLSHVQVVEGHAATKDMVLGLNAPGVLHIATHVMIRPTLNAQEGAFLRNKCAAGLSREIGEEGLPMTLFDPLLRGALVLAGANDPGTLAAPHRREDSLVTALELAGLNLWGTQLVVLSACDSGRGDIALGQGVYGLRRALMLAGAETVVTSLWKVDDGITAELMTSYYGGLLDGQGRATALHEAMKKLRKTQPDPHYWAPFIAVGQDLPLQGVEPHGAVSEPTRRRTATGSR